MSAVEIKCEQCGEQIHYPDTAWWLHADSGIRSCRNDEMTFAEPAVVQERRPDFVLPVSQRPTSHTGVEFVGQRGAFVTVDVYKNGEVFVESVPA